MNNETAISKIVTALEGNEAFRALFLSGSFATDTADAFSDLDFVLVANEGPSDGIAKLWRHAVEQVGEIVLWWDRTTRPSLINAITADWVRLDLVILKPEDLRFQTQQTLKPLIDTEGLFDTLDKEITVKRPDPKRLGYQIEEFIRILGLLHLADGRREYLNGVLAIFHLRNLLVDLLIEETAAPFRGGMLHLNRLITDAQRHLLENLPPALPNRRSMIDCHMTYARIYLPRARALAQKTGILWPERFEAATWKKLNQTLGLKRPYDPDQIC